MTILQMEKLRAHRAYPSVDWVASGGAVTPPESQSLLEMITVGYLILHNEPPQNTS